MLNATYAAEAAAAFNATPATGPYTLAMSNSAIWVSLPNVTATYPTIIDAIRHLAKTPDPSALHLPAAYNADKTLTAGYRTQLLHLADLLANPHSPSLESAFATGTSAAAVHLHPLSRGTARLNLTDPFAPPILDLPLGLQPARHRRARGAHALPAAHDPHGYAAGAGRGGGGARGGAADGRGAGGVGAGNTVQSYMHPCCTVAMMPREEGGVVGRDLRVGWGCGGVEGGGYECAAGFAGGAFECDGLCCWGEGEIFSFFFFWVVGVSLVNQRGCCWF